MHLQLKVSNMACAACSDTITQAIKILDRSAIVQADPKTKLVQVETSAAETAVKAAIAAAGYTVE